jgi:hypothetical protein
VAGAISQLLAFLFRCWGLEKDSAQRRYDYCLLLTGIVIPKPEGFAQPLLLRFSSRSKSQKICCAIRAGALCASLLLDCYLTSEQLRATLASIFLKQFADVHSTTSSGPAKNAALQHIDGLQDYCLICTHHSAMLQISVQPLGNYTRCSDVSSTQFSLLRD